MKKHLLDDYNYFLSKFIIMYLLLI